MYPLEKLPPRKLDLGKGYERHPWVQRMDDFQQIDRHLSPERRLMAVAAYFGLCSFIDAQIGRVLDVLAKCGLEGDTRVIYTSDHGDNVGARALWGKSNLYEESAGIPLIIAGEGIPEGKISSTTTSLLDSYQTIMDGVGVELTVEEQGLKGESWLKIVNSPDNPDRIVFSEYHAVASPSGAFMLRKGKYKLVHYVGYDPELFDLHADPEETKNLAGKSNYAAVLDELEECLRTICDPDETDRQAKDDQNALIEKYGGPEKAIHMGPKSATPVPGQSEE
jgi:choline-sulfatase